VKQLKDIGKPEDESIKGILHPSRAATQSVKSILITEEIKAEKIVKKANIEAARLEVLVSE